MATVDLKARKQELATLRASVVTLEKQESELRAELEVTAEALVEARAAYDAARADLHRTVDQMITDSDTITTNVAR